MKLAKFNRLAYGGNYGTRWDANKIDSVLGTAHVIDDSWGLLHTSHRGDQLLRCSAKYNIDDDL